MRDDRRAWLMIFCLSLVVRLLTAWLLTGPPYMDAYYYTVGAWRLAEGDGFTEPFLWHYLDDQTGIPRPGFLYWMPLPSILAAPFVRVGALLSPTPPSPFDKFRAGSPGAGGSVPLLGRSFLVAQLPFVLLSALLPLVGYSIAWQTTGRRRHAWATGLLVLFSGLFFPYWTLPESFAPFALFGSLALWLAGCWVLDTGYWILDVGRWLLIGLLAGLSHLTRADGILLLPIVALAPLLSHLNKLGTPIPPSQSRTTHHAPRFTHHVLRIMFYVLRSTVVILGYLLVMGPWFLRNLSVIGTPLSPAGAKTLWLTTYDDFFCYGCDLSFRSYLAWGWGNIVHSKLFALWANFQRLLAEDCLVFLLPFVLIGLYRLRRRLPFTLSLMYLFLLYLAHSLVFTFPGWRGGFFHSSGALLPFLYTAAMEGLDAAVRWVARRRRGWNVRQARPVFTAGSVVMAIFLSLYSGLSKLPSWRNADQIYREIGTWLTTRGVPSSTIVMVGNPPGFWYHTGRPAAVVPNGGVEDLLMVAERYHVKYLLLDRNCPAPLAALYAGEESIGEENHMRLSVVATWEEGEGRAVLYAVEW